MLDEESVHPSRNGHSAANVTLRWRRTVREPVARQVRMQLP